MRMSQCEREAIRFEMECAVYSFFKALQACDGFLKLHGVNDPSYFHLAFSKLIEGMLQSEGQLDSSGHVLVCVEWLGGETFRITVQSDSGRDESEQFDMRVAHASNPIRGQAKTLVAALGQAWPASEDSN